MALGAAIYFTLPFEVAVPFAWLFAAISFFVGAFRRVAAPVRAIAFFIFGFVYSAAFTGFIATPIMPRNIHETSVVGNVHDIDYTSDKARIYLRVAADDIRAKGGNATVRLSVGRDDFDVNPGDTIRATVHLYRPTGADAPASFDYARWAYFNGISATGFISDYDVVSRAENTAVADLRDVIHRRADSFLTDALVLGYKNALDKETRQVWTAAGVAHIWSISGFHITLMSTWLFVVFFLICRSVPFITRRVPARIPATIFAWLGLSFYLFVSGAGVATVRAFVMASLVFGALIMGRGAISMRNIAIAFCAIFLVNPHLVMQAGFQLSFSAIFGLIWFWREFTFMPKNKFMAALYAAVMTSLVATIFTLPFVISHFNIVPTYGLVGNLILVPVFSFLIMPLVMLGTVAAMCGMHWPLSLANIIYDHAYAIAERIVAMPGSTIVMPHIPNSAMVCIVVGLAALMFVRPVRVRINYMISGVLVSAGILLTVFAPRPVFYSTSDNELIAFRENGKLVFNKSSSSNHFFTFDTWRAFNGERGTGKNNRRKAKNGLHEFKTSRFTIVYVAKYVPLAANIVQMCGADGPDYIVSYFRVDAPNCHAKILRGGFVMYESGRIKYIRNSRIWHGVNNRN